MKRFLITIKGEAQKTFSIASKANKGKSEPKTEESIANRVKLRREKITEIEEEQKKLKQCIV